MYFSEHAWDSLEDRSFFTPEQQLKERSERLTERYRELLLSDRNEEAAVPLTEAELRTALPEELTSLRNVEVALLLASNDLAAYEVPWEETDDDTDDDTFLAA